MRNFLALFGKIIESIVVVFTESMSFRRERNHECIGIDNLAHFTFTLFLGDDLQYKDI